MIPVRELDDQVRAIGQFMDMEFDEEYAQKREQDWTYWRHLKNGNRVISFHTGDYKLQDRWQIRAEFPKDDKGQLQQDSYHRKWPEITVSMGKGAEKIAKDIKSRLLPGYEEQLKVVLARIESANKYYAGKMNQIFKIADFLGLVRPADDSRTTLFPDHDRGVYRIDPYSDKAVKFEVQVDADKAIEILKILGYGK